MNKKILVVSAFVFSFAIFHSCNNPLVEDEGLINQELKSAGQAKKSYIVVLNDSELNSELSNLKGYEKKQDAVNKATAKILKRTGITDGEVGFVYGTAVKGFSVMIPPGQLKKLQDDPSVSYIEEDQVISLVIPELTIKKGKPGGGGGSTSQTVPWGITRVNGGNTTPSGTAWVIDTGIDLDHPDLNVDASRSKTFVNSKSADDDNGHGSHCAGIIGALNNSIGVVGVAPGATLVAVKVLTRSGSGSTSGVIAGVNYVAANAKNGDVANMSLGGGVSTTLDNAVIVASASCKFALAAGNEGDNANNHSPARVNGNNIYTISAMDSKNTMPSWSNFGNPPVDFCEPGVSILSCYKGGAYATMSGTSMATPHAAGLLLLGNIRNGGTVLGDTDGNPDIIGVH